jgi:hypothetical protein
MHAPDFQSHLQQQVNGMYSPAATVVAADHAMAMQNLQSHLSWYNETFGGPSPPIQNMQGPFMQAAFTPGQEITPQMYMAQAAACGQNVTVATVGQPQTVPNTPQHIRAQGWPSPPLSRAKHGRSQSFQAENAAIMQASNKGSFAVNAAAYSNGSFDFGEDQTYEASAYSSSIADPSSPAYQHASSMPTVYEEDHLAMIGQPADALLLVTAGAHNFNDPNFIIGGMCQEQATLDQMGIDATYIETGTKESDLDAWLDSPHGDVKYYICKWDGCAHPQINRKENARSHVQNHLDDRKWKCNPCEKRFTRLHDLKRHALTHTNERPAICPCGKSFARQDALTRHRQRDMCKGVLPGFEKTEEEKPKRGRPKKDRSGELSDKLRKTNRPDMDTRAHKAAMARAMDKANASADHHIHHSTFGTSACSSSANSDSSMPDTPPHESEPMDAVNFFDIDGAVTGIVAASQNWLDTPPSSPPTISMHAVSKGIECLPLANANFTSMTYHDMSSPRDQTDAMGSSLNSASSPMRQEECVSKHSPAHATMAGAQEASTRNDSFFGDSTSTATITQAASAHIDEPAPFTNFLSSVALTGHTDFGASMGCELSAADLFGSATALLDSYPGAGEDPFSPPGDSNSGSSTYNSSDVDTIDDKIFRHPQNALNAKHISPIATSIFNDRVDDAFGNPFDDPGFADPTTEEQIQAFLAGL